MKTNSRKRLLVSSVAMLLVAMLALGTATYAWFTQNTTATAQDLSVKTIKASELKVSSKEIGWTDSLDYGFKGKVLQPVSTANGYSWFAATAASKTASTADLDSVTDVSADLSKYAVVDQLNIQNQGGAEVTNVKINFTLSEKTANNSITDYKYLRVALVPVATRAYAPTDDAADEIKTAYATNFATHVYAAGKNKDLTAQFADAITGIVYKDVAETDGDDTQDQDGDGSNTTMKVRDKLATSKVTAIDASSSTFSVDLGFNLKPLGYTPTSDSDTGTDTAYFNLYVWFEGQDGDCQDNYAGNVMPEITFTVTADNVAQN